MFDDAVRSASRLDVDRVLLVDQRISFRELDTLPSTLDEGPDVCMVRAVGILQNLSQPRAGGKISFQVNV